MSTKDHFDHEGPKYLTNLDWENHDHQRIVAACLVKAASVLEKDLEKKRRGGNRLAPPWWEFFGFELVRRIEDSANHITSSTAGAVFRLKASITPPTYAPTIVIAVRGTRNLLDWGVNVDTLFGHAPQLHRYRTVMSVAEEVSGDHCKGSNLWLCGHSLGATVATVVGEKMAMKGCFFTTFLFNPPYILNGRIDKTLLLFNQIREEAGHLVKGVIAGTVGDSITRLVNHFKNNRNDNRNEEELEELQCFDNLNKWDPRVYVNPKDWLCDRYIEYFEKKMKGSPTQLPKRMASATLVINLDEPGHVLLNFEEAHTIMQWLKPGVRVKAKRYVMA